MKKRIAAITLGLLVAGASLTLLLAKERCEVDNADGESTARVWNEAALNAIRRDFPAPTVHSRNLFHLSTAMWDAAAAFDPSMTAVFATETAPDDANRDDAISYAAYRVLTHRYENSAGAESSLAEFDATLAGQCLAPNDANPSADLGNRIADLTLSETRDDGSREASGYVDLSYAPVNPPLIVSEPGTELIDPNRWQPLSLSLQITQNGQTLPAGLQDYVGPNWGYVTPFALDPSADGLPIDPGPPPYLTTLTQAGDDAEFEAAALDVVRYSGLLDPTSDRTIPIDPGHRGNNPLATNDGEGHQTNPITGSSYTPNIVSEADYGRVIAEFWADGPHSETPPGHWNTLANEVSDDLEAAGNLKVEGLGPSLERLDWDLRLYLGLNGALHDAAIGAWGAKAHYDYIRPISMIRYLGQEHQLPLETGISEVITAESSAAGERHESLATYVGEIAIFAWRGQPANVTTDTAGVGWIRAVEWVPYQRASFVTPAFAAYVSGHSTFSRAAAEVMTSITGSEFFPNGMKTVTVEPGGLIHEYGPSSTVTLQWATYYDASDEAGLSRIYGGIHVSADDLNGRAMGSIVGIGAWEKAKTYFSS